MEKEQHDSMATVQMKADYAASEVYSTASEPPPAYRRETSSVRIAKIIGLTVVASSFIIGVFILASSYLQARASCDQMQTLDSILEKELMLETLQELPKAEPLLSGRDLSSENDMQSLDNNKKDIKTKTKSSTSDSDSDSSDSSFSESDEAEELNRVQIKMPLELSLSDLANTILQQNQKSRMNCVIERRRAEELVDNSPKMTPFGMNFNSEPKKRITGERMAIFCESGNAIKDDENDDDVEPRDITVQRIPFGAMPQQFPLTHMPQQQIPAQHMMPPQQQQIPPQIPFVVSNIIRQIVALQQQQQQQQQAQHQAQSFQQQQPQQHQMQQQQVPMGPGGPFMMRFHQFPMMEQQPQPSQPQQPMNGEIRIHLQRIPVQRDEVQIPIEVLQNRANVIRPIQAIRLQTVPDREQQTNYPQRDNSLQENFGLTTEDLMNIQRLAQERIEQELKSLAQDDFNSESSSSESDEDDGSDDSVANAGQQNSQQQTEQTKMDNSKQMDVPLNAEEKGKSPISEDDESTDEQSEQTEKQNMDPQILQVGRAAYGRSIMMPVNIPNMDMMQKSAEDRLHFVQPRSIREE